MLVEPLILRTRLKEPRCFFQQCEGWWDLVSSGLSGWMSIPVGGGTTCDSWMNTSSLPWWSLDSLWTSERWAPEVMWISYTQKREKWLLVIWMYNLPATPPPFCCCVWLPADEWVFSVRGDDWFTGFCVKSGVEDSLLSQVYRIVCCIEFAGFCMGCFEWKRVVGAYQSLFCQVYGILFWVTFTWFCIESSLQKCGFSFEHSSQGLLLSPIYRILCWVRCAGFFAESGV